MSNQDRTALSYWFPKIEAAGVPAPRTKIIAMSPEAQKVVWKAFDGEEGTPEGEAAFVAFNAEIEKAGREFGLPFFLRTSHTSAKHSWSKTCFVADVSTIAYHVISIAEFSECAGIMGMPWDEWVVREMLPTVTFGVCKRYGDMPIAREFRCFVDDGKVVCTHPYWPRESLEQGAAPTDLDYEALCATADMSAVHALASTAGKAVGGAWSVDVLDTTKGWFVTDMAEARRSFHWKGCAHAERFAKPETVAP